MRILIFFFVLLCSNCNYRKSDAGSELLGNGYFYVNASNRGMIYKGDLEKTSTHILKISGNIERYGFNEKFIVAVRHITPLEIRDSATNALFEQQSNGDTLQFWVIEKAKDSIYGPLDSTQYKELSNRLKLSLEIKL